MNKTAEQDNLTVKGIKIVQVINAIIDYLILIVLVLLLIFASFYIWESKQIYDAADSKAFEIYKPSENNIESFDELKKINPDAFAWLTVYGTGIDYPVLQSDNNDKYLRTNATGQYSMSGSIFLDYRNNKNFIDYNSIIYGHHMQKKTMFGELDKFKNKKYFDKRKYANLFFNNKNHGLEFFAFIETDGYNGRLYVPAIQGMEAQSNYLSYILDNAIHTRDIDLKETDKIVLLSTCSSDLTNGRHILVARLSDKTFKNGFENNKNYGDGTDKFSLLDLIKDMPLWFWVFIVLTILVLLTLLDRRQRKKKVLSYKEMERKKYF